MAQNILDDVIFSQEPHLRDIQKKSSKNKTILDHFGSQNVSLLNNKQKVPFSSNFKSNFNLSSKNQTGWLYGNNYGREIIRTEEEEEEEKNEMDKETDENDEEEEEDLNSSIDFMDLDDGDEFFESDDENYMDNDEEDGFQSFNTHEKEFLYYSPESILHSKINDSPTERRLDTDYENYNEFDRLKFSDRIHYNTVQLVHSSVYEWYTKKHVKELEKILSYDNIKEFKHSIKAASKRINKTGDEKIKDLKYWLDNLGLKRHIHQVRFHEHMIKACLTKIYESEWETQYESIMKKFNVEKMKRELLFSCPRRFGKTYSVAIFCAAYMLSVPNSQIAVFSTGKRTAKKLMMLIVSFLSRFPEFESHVHTKNHEDLIIKFGEFDARQLSCYPSTVKVFFLLLFL